MTSDDINDKLRTCFAAVFPEIEEDRLSAIQAGDLEAWDSIAFVTLMAIVEDEFGVEIGAESMEDLDSFAAVRDYLSERLSAA